MTLAERFSAALKPMMVLAVCAIAIVGLVGWWVAGMALLVCLCAVVGYEAFEYAMMAFTVSDDDDNDTPQHGAPSFAVPDMAERH